MYEVTYSLNGVIKTMSIKAQDVNEVNEVMLNMFTGHPFEIINIVRKGG